MSGTEPDLAMLARQQRQIQNTKGFLVTDALVSSRHWLDLEARVANLEKK